MIIHYNEDDPCERCNNKLEFCQAHPPWTEEHLICPKCDSTYNIELIEYECPECNINLIEQSVGYPWDHELWLCSSCGFTHIKKNKPTRKG